MKLMKILKAIIAHKDFEWTDLPEEELKTYLVFTPNDIKTNIPNVHKFVEVEGYDNRIYSELSHLKYIRDNMNFDWIHINHYRRRFEVPDHKHLYVADPFRMKGTNREFYKEYHNVKDLDLMTDIVQDLINSNFQIQWIQMLNNKYLFPYNIASIPYDIFCEWIDISTKLLDEFKNRRNLHNYEQIQKYVKTHKNEYKNGGDNESVRVLYNMRIFAYLWERITSMYFQVYAKFHNNPPNIINPLLTAPVKLLEENQKI